jgi:hypothetical protein
MEKRGETKHTMCYDMATISITLKASWHSPHPSSLPQSLLSDGPLRGEAGDGPHADLDALVQLLAAHVPHALVRHHLRSGLQHNIQQLQRCLDDLCVHPKH